MEKDNYLDLNCVGTRCGADCVHAKVPPAAAECMLLSAELYPSSPVQAVTRLVQPLIRSVGPICASCVVVKGKAVCRGCRHIYDGGEGLAFQMIIDLEGHTFDCARRMVWNAEDCTCGKDIGEFVPAKVLCELVEGVGESPWENRRANGSR